MHIVFVSTSIAIRLEYKKEAKHKKYIGSRDKRLA